MAATLALATQRGQWHGRSFGHPGETTDRPRPPGTHDVMRARAECCFDMSIVVDWSASSTPKLGRDSIWSCIHDWASGSSTTVNHPTRRMAHAYIERALIEHDDRCIPVGFDTPYGYPRGFARAAALIARTRRQRRGSPRGNTSRRASKTDPTTPTTGSRLPRI